ncbi:FGGY-family carbohydrate kinase [Oculatella sp. FACHB-28]|uniref:FGGY-family carbohydrate kinase n=1 Tax=Oculatella sp. FACHB-28 TaxID=2692845 RepID=UPI001684A1D8|nr:FGGY-family carbohydrate kinase [Oculatella sp. FACHB-28]MBD2056118.1 FGGY-family carbohydrate kinase [Oculatella sp. FACHB-28]
MALDYTPSDNTPAGVSGSYVGIDFGTSGARAIAINTHQQIQAQTSFRFEDDQDLATIWQTALFTLLEQLPVEIRQQLKAIAINGTSSTVLICDARGIPLDQPILYNDARGMAVMDQVKTIAPPNHTVISATSSLAKLLWWATCTEVMCVSSEAYFLHQADWLAFLLHGQLGISDYHNALKLGYDVGELRYPNWMQELPVSFKLPQVVAPGTPIEVVKREIVTQFHLPADCLVCAGTTDSIAAFLASGVQFPGEAVTSLGSTLVLKLLSETRVDDARYGIYSHRLGDLWLVGGASNTGGAVLKQFFTDAELKHSSEQIQPAQVSPLDYYPLLTPGERFPINDPQLQPRLDPRPDRPVEFLHGLLEGIARIEARGYRLLQELGATPLSQVYTAGGGAKNLIWAEMRSRHLQVPVLPSAQTEAAYGTALLASRQTPYLDR